MHYKEYIKKSKHAKRIIMRESPETWEMIKHWHLRKSSVADIEWWVNYFSTNPMPLPVIPWMDCRVTGKSWDDKVNEQRIC